MPGWDAALDAMTELSHAFKTTEYQSYLDNFSGNLTRNARVFDLETGETLEGGVDGERVRGLVNAGLHTIEVAEPVWVSADVTQLIQYASDHESFKPQMILAEDLFTPAGFCLFEEPLVTIDIKGLEFRYRAISWELRAPSYGNPAHAVIICKWSHRDDPDGIDALDPAGRRREAMLGGSPFRLTHVDSIPLGEARFLVDQKIANSIAQYEALWRLARQKIVVFAPERASRATWRRASHWRAIKEVAVLRLRRAEYRAPTKEGTGTQMSYRTNVRAHWRDQYYSSLGPVGDPKAYKQKWIAEYIKGNPDGPLIIKKHAVEFTR